jgi:hypothetical protein
VRDSRRHGLGLDGRLAAAVWHWHAGDAHILIEQGAEPEAAIAFIRGWGADPSSLQSAKGLLQRIEQDREAKVATPPQPTTEAQPQQAPAPWWNKSDGK